MSAAASMRRSTTTGSLLHAAMAQWQVPLWNTVNESLAVFPPGYPIAIPDDRLAADLVLDPDTAARKVRALAAQANQTAELIAAMGVECYTAWVDGESFVERIARPQLAQPIKIG